MTTTNPRQKTDKPRKSRRGRPPKPRPLAESPELPSLLRHYGKHLEEIHRQDLRLQQSLLRKRYDIGSGGRPEEERLTRHLLDTSEGAKQYAEAVCAQEVHTYSRLLAGLDRVFRLVGGYVNPKIATGLMGLLGTGDGLARLLPVDLPFLVAASILGPQGTQFYVRNFVPARDAIVIMSSLAEEYAKGI